VPEFVTKIIQVFDCKVARHGNMIVGRTGEIADWPYLSSTSPPAALLD
jgi:hypothetical protein